jgi:hypothetical protein
VLESIAGVPGFVAAGFRHFHSLRKLTRDFGWIGTLLEVRLQFNFVVEVITSGSWQRRRPRTNECISSFA